eukprot:3888977-Prymnesium_polylepis.1
MCGAGRQPRDRRRTSEVTGSYIQPLRAPNTGVRSPSNPCPRRPINAHALTWLRYGMRVREVLRARWLRPRPRTMPRPPPPSRSPPSPHRHH